MTNQFHTWLTVILAASVIQTSWAPPSSADFSGHRPVPPEPDRNGVLALHGEFVHNVGELQVNITNWGLIGSQPNQGFSYSDAPSAQWPAGSGVEYLFAAGLWIGAIRNGVPRVTTGQFDTELKANPDDPLDTVWESYQGADHGKRYPDPSEDDDRDGQIDEDPINGLDDDGDGAIDEDFGAIGNQMFRVVMRDNTALVIEEWPNHEPLDLRVVQTSYAWENDTVDDFVGFDYEVTNIGVQPLESVYVGFFADSDVGPRGEDGVASDDVHGWFNGTVRAADESDVRITVAYMYDDDGDGGLTEGYFGIMFLDHPVDPSGELAPVRVAITSYNAFAGRQEFSAGGEPLNDAERYELLSTPSFDPPAPISKANDFRILLGTGPFAELDVGNTLKFSACMVVGAGESGLLQHAGDAALTYYGAFFDRDLDPNTGVEGRETRVCAQDFGSSAADPQNPVYGLFTNPCDTLGLGGAGGELPPTINANDLDDEGCIYVNSDCYFEMDRRGGLNNCATERSLPAESLGGCTGVRGEEFGTRWLVGLAPVAPDLRLWQTDNRTHVYWNSMSQIIPDVRLQQVDFEAYRIWRADGWDRPFGASIRNGPDASLWSLIAEYDVVNYFENRRNVDGGILVEELPLGANTGLDVVAYTPLACRPGTPEYDAAAPARQFVQELLEDPAFAFLNATTDPAEFLRYRDEHGRLSVVAQHHPQLREFQDSYADLDTAYWEQTGLEFYEYVDSDVFNGQAYFYAVTATDFEADASSGVAIPTGPGLSGDPQSNFDFAVPRFAAQTARKRASDGQNVFVFPNPATPTSLAEFSQFKPNADDPTGVRVMFANLPASRNTIRIFTLAGDLVESIEHDGTTWDCPDQETFGNCGGAAFWNLVSRNGQEVVSGIYLFSVESADPAFDRVIGRFAVVR